MDPKQKNEVSIKELQDQMILFRNERNWEKFHNPKDLAIAISIEANELLEHFLFRTNEQIAEKLKTDPAYEKEIAHEMIDILNYLLVLTHTLDLDIKERFYEKFELIKKKYPVEIYHGEKYPKKRS